MGKRRWMVFLTVDAEKLHQEIVWATTRYGAVEKAMKRAGLRFWGKALVYRECIEY